jgi:UDP-N-acetylmuramoyl-tripeptide--D-alanyl-D-alanine ligase
VLLNSDDALIVDNYSRFAQDKKIEWYSAKNNELSKITVDNIHTDIQNLSLNFDLNLGKDDIVTLSSKILADYIIGYIQAAFILGKELEMSDAELRIGVSKIKPVEHRLEAKRVDGDVIIIDDTYNGNSDGIKTGIELLSKFEGRRKVYITPGLVETGSLTESIHLEIGRQLSEVADLVVLTKNSATPFIEKGLLDAGFNKENIIWFETSKETYSSLNTFVKPGDVVMMQNDWSDNYS